MMSIHGKPVLKRSICSMSLGLSLIFSILKFIVVSYMYISRL